MHAETPSQQWRCKSFPAWLQLQNGGLGQLIALMEMGAASACLGARHRLAMLPPPLVLSLQEYMVLVLVSFVSNGKCRKYTEPALT